jgi:hypothetical protein
MDAANQVRVAPVHPPPILTRRARLRRWTARRGMRLVASDGVVLLALVVASLGLAAGGLTWPRAFPDSTLTLVLLAGGFLLRMRSLLVLYAVVAALLGLAVADRSSTGAGSLVVIAVIGVAVLLLARTRARLGVQGTFGESMLVDLRDRLRQQGELPALPPGWHAEVVLRSAWGASFSGDFLVASRSAQRGTLEVALVDVSGKGLAAGTRALLLSGAFGGLLGSMPAEGFLPAANSYVLRQDWPEGFATAVHVVVDLTTGDYVVRSAGHPPAAHFVAGSGCWRLHDAARGPALGILDAAGFEAERGRLDSGDALVLYTDGLVEAPGRDLSLGIDRLLGQADRLVTHGFRDGASVLITSGASGESDDRALVLIWRS